MKSSPLKIRLLTILFIIGLTHIHYLSYSQCAAAPVAAAACSGTLLASNANVNSGLYYYSGASTTMSNVNMGGGTIRVCGTLTLSSPNLNSGTLIVESGGNLTITSMPSMNGNITIINRGTLTLNGSFTMQNSNNYIYNDVSTSNLVINGTVTVNGTSSYIINRGMMNFTGLYYQAEASGVCLQDNSIFTISTFNNITTNSFTYSGAGSPACLNVTSSAVLQDNVTASSKIHVCLAGSETTSGGATVNVGGGWGSAPVTTNCSSCAVVLALVGLTLTADKEGPGIRLEWTVEGSPAGNEIFYVEKSADGIHFNTLSSVQAITNQYTYMLYDAAVDAPKLYYRIKAVSPTGANNYSAITLVETDSAGQFLLYPNPAKPNTAITLVIPSPTAEKALISLVDRIGQVLRTRSANLTAGSNTLVWDLQDLIAGVYFVRITFTAHGNLYGRISVLAN